jgi:hypothetical protein
MHARPHPGLLPGIQSPPARHPASAPQFAWQMAPSDTGQQHIDDPIQHASITGPRTATTTLGGGGRNERGHDGPQLVIDKLSAHSLA